MIEFSDALLEARRERLMGSETFKRADAAAAAAEERIAALKEAQANDPGAAPSSSARVIGSGNEAGQQQTSPAMSASGNPTKEAPGVLAEAGKAVVGGIADAGVEFFRAIDDAAKWLDENVMNLRMDNLGVAAQAEGRIVDGLEAGVDYVLGKNESVAGDFARNTVRFFTGFIPMMRATKFMGAGKGAMAARSLTSGAAVDAAFTNPESARLADLFAEYVSENPSIGKDALDYLRSDPSDTHGEARFKNALEGLALGGALDLTFKGIKALRARMRSSGDADLTALTAKIEEKIAARETAIGAAKVTGDAPLPGGKQSAAPGPDQLSAMRKQEATFQDQIANVQAGKDAGEQYKMSRLTPEGLDNAWKAVKEDGQRVWVDFTKGEVNFSNTRPAYGLDLGKMAKEALEPASRDPKIPLENYLKGAEVYRDLQLAALGKRAGSVADVAGAGVRQTGDAMSERAVRESLDDVLADIRMNAEDLMKVVGKMDTATAKEFTKQAGFANPAVLAHMASGMIGAGIGASNAPDNESLLMYAGLGAIAGLGVSFGSGKAYKSISKLGPEQAAKRAKAAETATEAASPAFSHTLHKSAVDAMKAPPRPAIPHTKVKELADAMAEGRTADVAALAKDGFNLDRLDTDEGIKQTIDAVSAMFEKNIDKVRGGKYQSHDDVVALAKTLGTNEQDIKEMLKGTHNLQSRLYAARTLLIASAEDVNAKRAFVLSKEGTNFEHASVLELMASLQKHAALQAQIRGVQSNVARTLSALRISAKSGDLALREAEGLVLSMGGITDARKFAKVLGEIDESDLASIAREAAAQHRNNSTFFEIWVNGILSGPATHAANIIGNTMTTVFGLGEKGVAMGVGQIRRKLGLGNMEDYIRAGEGRAMLYGYSAAMKELFAINSAGMKTLREATGQLLTGRVREAGETMARANPEDLGSAYRSFGTGEAILDRGVRQGTMDFEHAPAISAANYGWRNDSFAGRVVDGLGAAIRTQGSRMLTTGDEVFKTFNYRGELHAQAFRDASRLGLKGADFEAHVRKIIADPPNDISAAAMNAAREYTFTKELGKSGSSIQNAVRSTPGVSFIVPFIRTPMNIMKFAHRASPLAPIGKSFWDDIAAGGVRADMAIGRMATGSGFVFLAYDLHQRGLISGGGDKEQSSERLAGRQQYSIKVGDKQYSFSRLDPIGFLLGATKDLIDLGPQISKGEADQIAASIMLVMNRNLSDRTYLKGLTDFVQMISESERYGERYFQRFAGSWVPNWMASYNRTQSDPYVKEAWSIIDSIKSRVPGFSKTVPNHVDLFGNEVTYSGGLGPDIASPIREQEFSTSKFANVIADLNIDLKRMNKTFPVEGTPGVELTAQQYHDMMVHAGKWFKREGEKLVQKASFSSLPDLAENAENGYISSKEVYIRKLWEQAKSYGRKQLLSSDRVLNQEIINMKRNRVRALKGESVIEQLNNR